MSKLDDLLENLSDEVARREAQLSAPRGGMRVGDFGDFVNVPPSGIHRLRWWVRELQKARAEENK